MNKKKVVLYICIATFGFIGVYFTFFAGNVSDYDSQTKAYNIYPNESFDSDDGTTYQPIYYFRVNGKDYECKAKVGSSSYPDESKNVVYYDSANPTKCLTEYERSSGKFAGIICLIVTAIIIYFFIIKRPSNITEDSNNTQETNIEVPNQFGQENNIETQMQLEQEKVEKAIEVIEKVQLIYKRVVIGIIIVILLFFILIDTSIFKQTIVAKDYPEAIAVFVDRKVDEESSLFDDCIYRFTDKNGIQQEIIVTVSKDETPKEEIKVKYNENNPQDYYGEGSTMDKAGLIWYIVKIVALILLIIVFFNKKILNKINISTSNN